MAQIDATPIERSTTGADRVAVGDLVTIDIAREGEYGLRDLLTQVTRHGGLLGHCKRRRSPIADYVDRVAFAIVDAWPLFGITPHFFVVLAGDRNGVSFYAYDRICDALELTPDEYVLVRNSLIDKDLIAFDGGRFQVLSLPPAPIVQTPAQRPLVTQDDFEDHDPATIQHIIRSSRSPPLTATSRIAPHRAACPGRSIHTTQRIQIQDPNERVTPDHDNRTGSDPPPRLDPIQTGT